jgi:hypothetical protein
VLSFLCHKQLPHSAVGDTEPGTASGILDVVNHPLLQLNFPIATRLPKHLIMGAVVNVIDRHRAEVEAEARSAAGQ